MSSPQHKLDRMACSGREEFWLILTALKSGDEIEGGAAFGGSRMPQLQGGVILMPLKYFRALTRVVAFMLVLGGLSGSQIAARLRIDFHHYLNESDHAPFAASALRSKPSFR
jgi:hypothetical protein